MACMNDVCVQSFLFINILTWSVNAEVFSAVHNLFPLVETHRTVIERFEKYIKDEETRIGNLKKYLLRFKKEHRLASADPVKYVTNPINAFSMINRLLNDVNEMKAITNKATANVTMDDCNCVMPTTSDLRGATEAIVRLQITYELKVKHIANGLLISTANHENRELREMVSNFSSPMSASDCYVIGKSLFEARDLYDIKTSLNWLIYALEKRSNEDHEQTFTSAHVMKLLSQAYLYFGDINTSFQWANMILQLNPDHEDVDLKYRDPKKTTFPNSTMIRHFPKYEAVCRGEKYLPHEIRKRLTCEYLTKYHPFLKIAPIKMERLYLDPEVYLMYDVVYEKEIRYLIDSGSEYLDRAAVRHENGTSTPSNARVSKSTWLHEEWSEDGAKLSQRLRDFTGLDTSTAERIQLGNYGIGGQYDTHYDFHRNESLMPLYGNRIATVLLYLTDVEQGGATVFPNLGLTVFPIRGAALYWINLHSSGAGDQDTLHAGCPVLRGSKWVANKWFHAVGQEFRRPCGVEYRGFDFKRTIPEALPRNNS